MLDLSLFDFALPDERIAQAPAPERDGSRLLVLPRTSPLEALPGALEHRTFRDLPGLLRPGDLLVQNETAVFPARLLGRRLETGGKVELLLLEPRPDGAWEALVRSKSRPRAGETIELLGRDGKPGAEAIFEADLGAGHGAVRFVGESALDVAARLGHVPLPPYIGGGRDSPGDRARYQTVYAREAGAVAAPTAGLHFTDAVFAGLAARGVTIARLVLHVGLGTFAPVRVTDLDQHTMHEERYAIPDETVAALASARSEGRRIVACGTTTVRALESYAATGVARGSTSIFLKPGHTFRLVDALVTNFHLPKSTLLVLISAFAGRERVLAAYAEAIARGYRFYSYGDAMLVG